ncbi:MAG TPA: L,D-transpeptidase family protein [Acidimicrobiia bacterium]|nr:L,D-transpeptidase family protein [Acidimicrobiia bacterium]
MIEPPFFDPIVRRPTVAAVPQGRHRRPVVGVLGALAVVVALPGIAGAKPAPRRVPGPPPAIVASVTVPSLAVFPAPGAATPSQALANPNRYGGQVVLLVSAIRPDGWVQVLLPVRPNDSTGWVRGSDVVLSNDPYRISLVLHLHQITVLNGKKLVLRSPVGIGKANTPTPGGVYYLTQLFKTPDPNGVYGPYAYSLSGYSNVLTTFEGGDAIIGLHGTNRPDLLGHDVSSGCIRLSNADLTTLAHLLPLGTPVTIVA